MQRGADWASTEVLTGVGLIVAGVAAQAAGLHDLFAQALVPFGIGMILSDAAGRAARAARERVAVRVRKDDE